METTDLALRWVILCASEAALRFATCVALRKIDVAGGVIRAETKFGRITAVPASPRIMALLDMVPDGRSEDRAIDVLEGRTLRAANTTLHNRFKALKVAKGVRPEIRFHDLRRGLAHRLYRQTGDLRAVQSLLSHQSLNSTLHYLWAQKADVNPVDLNAAIAGDYA